MTAADVIGKYLIAKKDLNLVAYPGGPKVGSIPAGNSFGPVYSWVNKPEGLYWAFDYTIPGNTPGGYFVLHDPAKIGLSSVTPGGEPADINVDYNVDVSSIPTWVWIAGAGALFLILNK